MSDETLPVGMVHQIGPWYRNTFHLIVVCITPSTIGTGRARTKAAVEVYRDALLVFIAARADHYRGVCRDNREMARALLNKRTSQDRFRSPSYQISRLSDFPEGMTGLILYRTSRQTAAWVECDGLGIAAR